MTGVVQLGVYVGRFCPPHNGHVRVIDELWKEYGEANSLVIVGSSNHEVSYRHLFSFGDRIEMLRHLYPHLNVVGLPDHETDELWLTDLWGTIDCWRHSRERPTLREVTFYGGCEEDVLFFINAGYKVHILNRFDGTGPKVSATEVRDALVHDRSLSGLIPEELKGIVRTCFQARWEELKKR